MPEDAPAAKLDATRGYGADVVPYDRWTESREEIGAALAEERGLALVQPYDDPLVMAGQGTVALELLEDAPELDLLLVPMSGGGLMAGCATAAKALRPGIRVVGVEPEAGDDTRRSLAAGERVRIDVPPTIADGLQATEPGELTFEVNRRLVDEVVTVTDEEIVRGDGVPLRPAEARRRAERRSRSRRAPEREGRGARAFRRRRALRRQRRRRPLRGARRYGFCRPSRVTSTSVCSALATSSSPPGRRPSTQPVSSSSIEP